MKTKILNKSECLKELQKVDAFTLCLNDYTLVNLLKQPSVKSYLNGIAEAPLDASDVQSEAITDIFNKVIKPKWKSLGLPNILINFGITNGRDMGMSGLPYTRGNTIFFCSQVLTHKYMKSKHFKQLIAHECFHVMSRENPRIRSKLYKFFGFKPSEDIDIGITNPDCPMNNYSIEIDGKDYVPYLEMPTTHSLSAHTMMFDLKERVSVKASDTKIYEMIGKTTQYVTHPEEICADFFMNLFEEGYEVDKVKLLKFKEELIKCLN